ncbi:MAG: hypothetical protein Q7S21_07130 [archaeon]|nr:hypothetical protein [archaeon]
MPVPKRRLTSQARQRRKKTNTQSRGNLLLLRELAKRQKAKKSDYEMTQGEAEERYK